MPPEKKPLAVDWRREYDLFVNAGRMLPKTLQRGSDATFSLGSFSDAMAIRRGYDDKERNKYHAGISAYVSKHVHEARADGLRKMKHGPWCYEIGRASCRERVEMAVGSVARTRGVG